MSLIILICIILGSVILTWAYNRRKNQEAMPIIKEITFAINESSYYKNTGVRELTILHQIPFTQDNLEQACTLLQSGYIDDALKLPGRTIETKKEIIIITFLSGNSKPYMGVIHDSPTSLGLEAAGIWDWYNAKEEL